MTQTNKKVLAAGKKDNSFRPANGRNRNALATKILVILTALASITVPMAVRYVHSVSVTVTVQQ